MPPLEKTHRENFLARITGHADDGDSRYKYAWIEVYEESEGYDGWTDTTNGLQSDNYDPERYARSLAEQAPGFTGPAVADDTIVRLYVVAREEKVEFWFCGPEVGSAATPADLLPESDDFETETAQTDEWDRADPPSGKDGLTVRLQTRTAYNHQGDKKLYAFFRELKFDSRGCLVTVSDETRVEVDPAEACTGS